MLFLVKMYSLVFILLIFFENYAFGYNVNLIPKNLNTWNNWNNNWNTWNTGCATANSIGKTCETGKWPWLAYINITMSSGKQTHCTGTIISENYILTAADCIRRFVTPIGVKEMVKNDEGEFVSVLIKANVIDDYSDADVILGYNSPEAAISVKISRAMPKWLDMWDVGDVAVLRLEVPLTFTQHIKPIKLLMFDSSDQNTLQKTATTAGWGRISETINGKITFKEPSSTTCVESQFPLTLGKECFKYYIGDENELIDKRLPAADGGAPLMFKKNEVWYQIGVTQQVPDWDVQRGFDKINYRIFFEDVRYNCDWIERTTKGEVKCEQDSSMNQGQLFVRRN
uniref:Peptidase S1 domain-containing protein n=1 Tax=Acrobeloides nanus TaxID=290746 RepID=A0A914D8V8_9BILA